MWRVQLYEKGDGEWLLTFENLFKFLEEHKEQTVGIKYIKIWEPQEKKEPLTRKEREAEPKEPIPLSRFDK